MSLKQEIETWVEALNHYDANEFVESLEKFDLIADTSKIFFNIAVIHATLGEHEKAVEAYQRAVRLDLYFAVAYFQQGVSNFLLGDFEEALANFNDALLYLRGNTLIDYDQLGLKFRLYSCEVLFNRGLCYMYLQQDEAGMQDFNYAVKEKQVEEHNVIDDAIRENAEGYTVFSIPVGVLYRPNESKVRNVKTKDYLGKARLVAASDKANAFTGFAGSENKRLMAEATAPTDDRSEGDISYAAMNLVIPGKTSKKPESTPPPPPSKAEGSQSFPPTPPPERDQGTQSRNRDNGGLDRKPSRGNNGQTQFSRTPSNARAGPSSRPVERRERRRDDIVEEEEMGGRYGAVSPPRRTGVSRSDTSASRSAYSRQGADVPRRAPTNASSRRREYANEQDGDDIDDFYDYYGNEGRSAYNNQRNSGGRKQSTRRKPSYDDDYQSEGDDASEEDEEFEMVGARRGSTKRVPDIRKIKVKIYGEDTRMLLISTNIDFDEFMVRLKDKMGLKKSCKCKVKDEDGEMILVADQEDLDMVIMTSKKNAKRSKAEMGKLDIWLQ